MDKDIEVGIRQLKDESKEKAAKTDQEKLSITQVKFNIAVQYVNVIKRISGILDNGTLLEFYGLYKQATVGDCNTKRPGFLDIEKRSMWDKWNKHNGKKTKDEAAADYVKLSISTIEDLKRDDKKFKKIVEELNKIDVTEERKSGGPKP